MFLDEYAGYTVAILAVLLAIAFWFAQKNTRRQKEWREAKLRDIEVRRAKIAARKKAEKQEEE